MTRGKKDIIVTEVDYTNAICSCGHSYTFASDKEMKPKERLHKKFCKNPPVEEAVVVSSIGRSKRAAMSQRQDAIEDAKEMKKFYSGDW